MNRQTAVHVFVIVSIAALVFFTSLGKARLWDRDEPRNAGCAAEMMERGDLVVPMFNDELRHQKPVLLYWLMISAYSVFGVTEFAARFWSATLAIGTALLTYGIARRLLDSSIAFLSAIILCSSIMFCVAARAATPDSALIFFSTLGIYFYVVGTFAPNLRGEAVLRTPNHWFPQNICYVVAMNVALAFAVLTKGPIGIVMPTAIVGMFLLIQRLPATSNVIQNQRIIERLTHATYSVARVIHPIHFLRTCWYMRPLTAIGTLILIAAPWYVAVHFQTHGDFSELFFLNENFARATKVMESHNGGWLYYPATIAVGFFPWSVFLGPMICAIIQQVSGHSKSSSAITFLVCWVAVQVGLFSIAETKLPSYVTPCYPALAILASFCLLRWVPQMATTGLRWQYAALSTYLLAGIVTAVGLAIASAHYFPEIWWISALGLFPIFGAATSIYLLLRQQNTNALYAITTSAVLFCVFMFGIGTVAVDSARKTDTIMELVKNSNVESIAAYHCLESSWVFYTEKRIYELHRGPATKQTPESLARDSFWQKKPVVMPEQFVNSNDNAIIITTDEHVSELLSRLPEGYQIVERTPFFLQQGRELILVQRSETTIAATSGQTVR